MILLPVQKYGTKEGDKSMKEMKKSKKGVVM
jgi:hypothetical protein